jgi:hypothetical protein
MNIWDTKKKLFVLDFPALVSFDRFDQQLPHSFHTASPHISNRQVSSPGCGTNDFGIALLRGNTEAWTLVSFKYIFSIGVTCCHMLSLQAICDMRMYLFVRDIRYLTPLYACDTARALALLSIASHESRAVSTCVNLCPWWPLPIPVASLCSNRCLCHCQCRSCQSLCWVALTCYNYGEAEIVSFPTVVPKA